MATWTPDPTFYPSPRLATQAPPEKLAYVASLDPTRKRPDAMAVVDLDPESADYGRIVGQTALAIGDELHHFGWNACSSCLCPNAPHPHIERRYLIVPGIRSSRLHILDTKPDPAHPQLIRTIEADELAKRAGYSRPHTVHCGPEGIYVSALADAEGKRPGGVFLMDHESFDVRGRWELDRGPQELAYDFWWHLGYDTMVTSEWGTPDMFEDGLIQKNSSAQSTGTGFISGICSSADTSKRSISVKNISWCSNCVQRTIRPKPMASRVSSSACKTSHRPYFCGTATEINGQRPR